MIQYTFIVNDNSFPKMEMKKPKKEYMKVKETKTRRSSDMYSVESAIDAGIEFKRDIHTVVGKVVLDGKTYKILG